MDWIHKLGDAEGSYAESCVRIDKNVIEEIN